ncbi:MAG: 4-hydroxythreonine-4-phosphate dehydrogenase PdxA [Mariprofundus sp.]|nr:4-hydroxythreonine-4-phosphate dehydrogenase PdxA [Mariprofundus sp.]
MIPLVITVGEPAGIGSDCILRAWSGQKDTFEHSIIAAPAKWLQERLELIDIDIPIKEYDNINEATLNASSNSVEGLICWNPLSTQNSCPVMAGNPSQRTAKAVVHCIEAAANACLHGKAAALVTGPIEKAVLRSAGFEFPGHTEFLAHLSAVAMQQPTKQSDFVMMLASNQIRVALLTTHMALRDVPDALKTSSTLKCLQIVDHDLRSRFGIEAPRLALCALNPHAGEQGHFGREEIDVLAPAAQQARDCGLNVSNPLPADTVFSANMRQAYDAIVCCYHDQALIPLKTLSFGEAVNITLGLPFIRTSVDHGTALDRVGTEDVSCTSLLAAIRMARQMAAND